MNGHETEEASQQNNPSTPVIIENHYGYPAQSKQNKSLNNILQSDINNTGLSEDQIEQLQNLMIEQQKSIQVEGGGSNQNNNNNNCDNNNGNKISNDINERSIFETEHIGEPDDENIANKSIETPQIPPDELNNNNNKNKSKSTPQKPKTKDKTTKGATAGKVSTLISPSSTTAKIWNWINNNCLRPFVQSFQQQVIADSIQIGLSIFPIIPIWRYLPEKMFGTPIDPCQNRPDSFWEMQRELQNKPKPKKSIIKKLWSAEGFLLLSVLGTLLTIVLIDSDDGTRSTPNNKPNNRQNNRQNNNNNRGDYFQASSFQNYQQSVYQAASVPNVPTIT